MIGVAIAGRWCANSPSIYTFRCGEIPSMLGCAYFAPIWHSPRGLLTNVSKRTAKPKLPGAGAPDPRPLPESCQDAGLRAQGNNRRRRALPPSASHTGPLFEVWGRPWRITPQGATDTPLVYDRQSVAARRRAPLGHTTPRPCPGPQFASAHAPLPLTSALFTASRVPLLALSGRGPLTTHTPLPDRRLGTSAASEQLASRPLRSKTLRLWRTGMAFSLLAPRRGGYYKGPGGPVYLPSGE